jgi:dTDP-4-dehydrorhamnose reductase
MYKVKICILGSNGLLGRILSKKLKNSQNKIFLVSKRQQPNKCKYFYQLDILNNKKFKNIFKILKPDVIINCVANTNVDNCQKFKNKALITNYKTVKNIVFALKKINLKPHIIHISTDQVYNGSSKKPNREININLTNHYSISKYKGEKALKNYKKKTILRTNFFGKSENSQKKSFSETIINFSKKKKPLNIPFNIFFNPTNFKIITKVIKIIIKDKVYGTYNLGSRGSMSKYIFAKKILKNKKLSEKNIIPYKSKFKTNKRPFNTTMNVSKLEKKLKIKLPTITNAILNA